MNYGNLSDFQMLSKLTGQQGLNNNTRDFIAN